MYVPKWLRRIIPAKPINRVAVSSYHRDIPFIAELAGGRRVYSTLSVREVTSTSVYFTNGGKITAGRSGSLSVNTNSGTLIITDRSGHVITRIIAG
jgi:hypothetical protein